MTRSSSRQVLRFVAAGAVNSGATWLLYLALLQWFSYRWAYSLSYVAGILLSFLLNSRFVFRVPLRWGKLLRYPLVYVVQYLLGYGVIYGVVGLAGLDPRLGPAAVLAVTVPVGFLLSRWVLSGDEKDGKDLGACRP
ncbi:MAG TPA: GtrA family protein [Thermoanaerobaculia bacterium]|nr:GtrA family protein [Thermoanaerobaculia bacterium]